MSDNPKFKMTFVKVLRPAPNDSPTRDPIWKFVHVTKVSKKNDMYKCAYCCGSSKVILHRNGNVVPHAEHSAKADAVANNCRTLEEDFNELAFIETHKSHLE